MDIFLIILGLTGFAVISFIAGWFIGVTMAARMIKQKLDKKDEIESN